MSYSSSPRTPERFFENVRKALWDIEPIPFRSFLPAKDGRTRGVSVETWMMAMTAYLRATQDHDDWPRAKKREAFSFMFRAFIGRPRLPKKPLLSDGERRAMQLAHDELALEVVRFSLSR